MTASREKGLNSYSSSKNLIKIIARKLFKVLFRIELKGLENYPINSKRVVIVANHVSLLDGILLWLFLPINVTFAINFFIAQKWWASWVPLFTRVFLVDPTQPMAIKSLIEYIATNQHCVIFPEGRITTTGGLMKIYEGPGLIADHTQALLLPIHIEGAQFSIFSQLSGKLKLHLLPKIQLTIAPPQYLTVPTDLKGRQRRKALSEQLYDIMCETAFSSKNLNKTLFESLIEAQKNYGKRQIIIEDISRKTLSYQQLLMRSFIFGKAIQRLIKAQEIIGMLLPNTMSHLIVFFGIQTRFGVPALLNYTISTDQLVKCCKTSGINTIFTARKFIETANLITTIAALEQEGIQIVFIEDIAKQITSINRLLGFFWSFLPNIYYKKSQKIIGANTTELINNPALILFTSGSENTPKGVVLSHQNLQANRFQLTTKLSFTLQDTIFNALPLFHAFSLNAGFLVPIFSGIKVFIYPTPLHFRKIPELCYETNATILFSANTFLAKYAKFANAYDFYSLKYVFAGAEKLQNETHQVWLEKFGIRILEGYGTTETSPVLAVNTPIQNKTGSVGKLLPHIHCQLKPIEGIQEGGELWVKGPNIMLGYLNIENPGTLTATKDGWHSTGDIVCIDQAGFITIQDRIKRFAKIGGEMISLSSIETCINQLWPDFLHAVISKSDPQKGEQIILVTTHPEAARQTIIQHAKELGLSNLAIPKEIRIIAKMPLLATGKINYRDL